MARFFARLVGGVFLRALVVQHVAERGRQGQRALLAVQDRGEAASAMLALANAIFCSRVIGVADARCGRSAKNSSGRIMLVFACRRARSKSMYFLSSGSQKWSWVAEMILSKAVERLAVALDFQHGGKVARVGRVIGNVFGNLRHGFL